MLRNGNAKFVNAATARFTEQMNTCDGAVRHHTYRRVVSVGRDAGSGMRCNKVSYRSARCSFQDLLSMTTLAMLYLETVNMFLRRHVFAH